jgi:hypothetical protein
MQKKMYKQTRCQRVVSLNTSHLPFFSAAEALIAHLRELEKYAANGFC